MPIWYHAIVTDIRQESPNVKRIWLKADGVVPRALAGQFLTFDLPIGEKRLERWRSYSIANAPNDDGLFELCVGKMSDGHASVYLCENIEVGDTLKFKGPEGSFVLRDAVVHDVVLICTGTGVAPFRSMLQEIAEQKLPYKSLHLIFGTRTEADILYRSEFEQLAQELPNFTYDIVLSRQSDWTGHHGYVHSVVEKAYGSPNSKTKFYLCGWQQMIDEAKTRLLKLGYENSQIHFELYG